MKGLFILLSCSQLWAQSLQILPAPPSGTAAGSFQIMFVSPSGKQPAAIQWRLTGSGITLSGVRVTVGSAAEQVKKSVTCAAAKGKDAAVSSLVCVLAGGKQPIPNGPIAVVRFTATAPSVDIRVSDVLGATAEGRPLPMPGIEMKLRAEELADK
jgi:hypothetical protein